MPVFNKMVYNWTEYILWWWANIWEPLNLTVTKSWLDATIKWEDNEIWTIPPTTFQKSELVRKIGSAPTSPSDWTLVVTETVKDTYKTTWYVDQWLTDWETYYYRVFSYSDLGGISYCDAVSITAWVTERPDIDDFVQTSHYSWYISSLHAIGIGWNWEYVYIGRDRNNLTQHTATNGNIANFDSAAQSSLSYQSRWLRCKSDGSVLYSFMDSSGIYQIDMSTPYSLTWATVNNYNIGYSICGWSLSYDGTKMYIGLWDSNYTKQFLECTLATPRDASSIWTPTLHTANEVTGSGQDIYIYSTQISPTWKKMYLAWTDGKIHQYNLATPYDWSTAVYYWYLDTWFGDRCPFQFLEDGQTIYMGNMNNKDLYQYTAN
jgi:hypothetical protein